jgi:tetratricopeptide (TPR) repeat protein
MAVFFVDKARNVVPYLRDLETTARLGELSTHNDRNFSQHNFRGLISILNQWKRNPCLSVALDLLNYAYVTNANVHCNEIQAAVKLVSSHDKSTELQRKLVEKFSVDNGTARNSLFQNSRLSDYFYVEKSQIYRRINFLKNLLIDMPRNHIAYVEMARLYTIIGQKDKSLRAIYAAFSLNPNNRFVVRSFIRLLVHYHDERWALTKLHKHTDNIITDPWILSAEIALSTMQNITSRYHRKALRIVNNWSKNYFHISELSSALATAEMQIGDRKKYRKLFKYSVILPNDNALAQIEWASSKDSALSIDLDKLQLTLMNEARARDHFYKQQWKEALIYLEQWQIDQPFSKTPLLMRAWITSSVFHNHKEAAEISKRGLDPHHNDPQLFNNIAYYYALQNLCTDALHYLNKIDHSQCDSILALCSIATEGLIEYRLGHIESGRALYAKAIEKAEQLKNNELYTLAKLNQIREEVIYNRTATSDQMVFIDGLKGEISIDAMFIKNDILSMIRK